MPEAHAIHLVPLAEIDDAALPRDRTALDPEALAELRDSICRSGLRLPVELFELSQPRDGRRYGILSGFRRIAAFRAITDFGITGHDAIPAFLRGRTDAAAAFAAMVEENSIRADLSPWERGRVAVVARGAGAFPSVEEAIDALYPDATAVKRARIRAVARTVDLLEHTLTAPEAYSERRLLRIAAAIANGFGSIIDDAVRLTPLRDPDSQWAAMLPYLVESERQTSSAESDPEHEARARETRGRPRRILRPRPHLVVRREIARDGYILRFTGIEATSSLLDKVLDEIELMLGPR